MKFSEKTDKILPAIRNVQLNAIAPVKSKTVDVPTKSGGKYSFTYADLREVMNSVMGLITENGLMLIQGTGVEPIAQLYGISTRIVHLESGQWVETFSEIDRKCTANEQGGEQTTFRRHQVTNIFAIVPTDEATTERPPAPRVGSVRAHAAPANKPATTRVGVRAPAPPPENFEGFPGGEPFNGRRG